MCNANRMLSHIKFYLEEEKKVYLLNLGDDDGGGGVDMNFSIYSNFSIIEHLSAMEFTISFICQKYLN